MSSLTKALFAQFGFGPSAKQRRQTMDKERKDFGDWLVAARDAKVDHERAIPNGSVSEALTNLRTYGQPEGPKPGKRCVNCRTLLSQGCPPRCGLYKRVVRTATGIDWGYPEPSPIHVDVAVNSVKGPRCDCGRRLLCYESSFHNGTVRVWCKGCDGDKQLFPMKFDYRAATTPERRALVEKWWGYSAVEPGSVEVSWNRAKAGCLQGCTCGDSFAAIAAAPLYRETSNKWPDIDCVRCRRILRGPDGDKVAKAWIDGVGEAGTITVIN